MKLTYKESGVDVQAADKLVADYGQLASAASTQHVLSGIGGFAGFLALPQGYKEPVLVACTDGVGTKLRLLIDANQAETAGKDAAAMCLNDLATSGASPLFMLDYLATGKLEPNTARQVVAGFADYCQRASCALLGGETAEMPGFYPPGDFDVAGFAVGVVDRQRIVTGEGCRAGDVVIGLASSGLHSNGFSLVRLLLEQGLLELTDDILNPTRLYLPLAQDLASREGVKAMAHITGGGLPGNVARTIPKDLDAVLNLNSWDRSDVFAAMAKAGVQQEEMLSTFNMGIGFTVVCDPAQAEEIMDTCRGAGVEGWEIGYLAPGKGRVKIGAQV